MNKIAAKHSALFILYVIAIAYLMLNTGIISDDFDAMARTKNSDFFRILIPGSPFYFQETPAEYFTHYIWYSFFSLDNQIAVNVTKILYIILSFYFISQFFSIYLNKAGSLLVSFLFLFFPSHDATVYWFMGQYLTLSCAFYLYAFYLAYKNKLISAFLLAIAASFVSYGSPVLAVSLFILFALEKQFRKGLVILVPNIFYSLYFLFMPRFTEGWIYRLPAKIEFFPIIKQFILQVVSFIDAMVGPSMWLKVYYSFYQLKPLSIAIGIIATIVFYFFYRREKNNYSPKLILALFSLMFLSFAMFAFTGFYPQLCFNLGNRATIFGSLLAAYLLALIPLSHKWRTLIFAVMIFCILGISDHWKAWNLKQESVIYNIKNNASLRTCSESNAIYIAGNQYSRYGPMSHIEFLSESWVPGSIFELSYGKKVRARPLNKRCIYKGGFFIDEKYNRKTKVDGYIYVYDSEKDELFKLKAEDINSYIESLPPDNRHWIQMAKGGFVKKAVLKAMPRVKYAF